MQRSDMLEIISEALLQNMYGGDEHEVEDNRSRSLMRRTKMAHVMLSAAEKAGMLPPPKEDIVSFEESDGQIVLPLWGWDE